MWLNGNFSAASISISCVAILRQRQRGCPGQKPASYVELEAKLSQIPECDRPDDGRSYSVQMSRERERDDRAQKRPGTGSVGVHLN